MKKRKTETLEELKKRLDELEHAETMDWVGNIKRREWKQSEEYAKRASLAEFYKNRKKV